MEVDPPFVWTEEYGAHYPLLDTVIKLDVEKLTGNMTFFNGYIYAFIDEDGVGQPARLPNPKDGINTAELYLARTKATATLKEGDIIALPIIENDLGHSVGAAFQKILKIHEPEDGEDEIIHMTTTSPQLEEAFDME